MAGTVEGGRKARDKNRELYGQDYYKVLGAKGGSKGTTGGFAAPGGRELARRAGAIGGKISRKPKKGTV